MDLLQLAQNIALYVLSGIGLVIVTYCVVRAGSYAHHRTKLEYLRRIRQEAEAAGENDGER